MGALNVMTFGSPRWANEPLAKYFDEIVDSNWRVVNEHDIVPTIPFQAMGFFHTATQIHYTDTESLTFTQCDGSGEDWQWNCYYLTTSVDDHLNYLNVEESCDADAAYEYTNTTTSSTSAAVGDGDDSESEGTVVYKVEHSLDTVPKVALSVGLAVGWIVAMVFCCFYCRARNELQKKGMSNTYQAFQDDIESL